MVPLSFAQNRLWLIDQLHGPSPVYNMAAALRLRGQLDAEALGAALSDVVGRHESLRTLFPAHQGTPQQVVMPVERADLGWDVVDAAGWSADQLDEGIARGGRATRLIWRTEIPLRAQPFRRRRGRTRPGDRPAPHRRRRLVAHAIRRRYGCGLCQPLCRTSPRVGPNWRSSTPITRCGSARSSVISTIAVAVSPHSWPIGRMPWPGCPSGCSFPPIGLTRGLPIFAAPRVEVDWPAELQQQVASGSP